VKINPVLAEPRTQSYFSRALTAVSAFLPPYTSDVEASSSRAPTRLANPKFWATENEEHN